MSTAQETLRAALPDLFNRIQNKLLNEVFPARPKTLLDDVIAKAKADADGGLVLFHLGDNYVAFGEDAETIARVIGVQLQTPEPSMFKRAALAGGVDRKQILLTASGLARNLRLLRMNGEQDIWIFSHGDGELKSADEIGGIGGVLDYDCARVLSRN